MKTISLKLAYLIFIGACIIICSFLNSCGFSRYRTTYSKHHKHYEIDNHSAAYHVYNKGW